MFAISKQRRGLTLIELVVVVAILAVLAAMVLPKLEGLQTAANYAATSSSVVDTAKLIQTYKAAKTVYPDGWDSLTDGTSLWTTGNVGTSTKGLHQSLSDPLTGKATLLTGALTTDQVTAFQKAGISVIYNVNAASTARPGDMFTVASTLSTSTPLVVVRTDTTGGKKIIDHFYRKNLLSTGTSGTLPTGTQLVLLGLGPQNNMINNSMVEAPVYGNANAQFIYNRLLAVFELTSNKVTFKGVVGADGDLLDDMSTKLNSAAL